MNRDPKKHQPFSADDFDPHAPEKETVVLNAGIDALKVLLRSPRVSPATFAELAARQASDVPGAQE